MVNFSDKIDGGVASPSISNIELKISRDIVDNMPNGVAYCQMIYDQGQPVDFVNLYTNPAFEQLTGLKDVLGKPVSQVIPHIHDTDSNLLDIFNQVASGEGSQKFETYVEAMSTSFSISVYSPEQQYFVVIFEIISERKTIEETIINNEKEARSMPQIVWVTRADGWNIYFNHQWMDYTGLTLAESYGHGWNKPFHPQDKQRAWDAWQNAVNNNDSYSLECRLRRADGVYRWWLIRGVPVFHASGEIYKWFGTCTDIHDIKIAEKELRQNQELLSSIINSAPSIIYALDLDQQLTLLNDAMERFSAKTKDQLIGKSVKGIFTNEIADSQIAINNHVLTTGKAFFGEELLISLDEHNPQIMITAKFPLFDDQGMIIGLGCVATDITERKQIEQSLTIAAKAFETYEGMMITDANNLILKVNSAMTKMTGYHADELRGQKPSILKSGRHDDKFYAQIWKSINTTGFWEGEIWNQRKNGEIYPEHITINAVKDSSGTVINYIATHFDITKSKQLKSLLLQNEAALTESRQILQTILDNMPAMIAYWHKDLTNKFANRAFQGWFGLSPDEMQGKHISQVLGEQLFTLNEPYIKAALNGQNQRFERAITDISGRQRYTQAAYIPDVVENEVQGFFVLVTEITDLKLAQQRISESEANLRAIYDNLPFLAWMKDVNGYFVNANSLWLESAGLKKVTECVGKTDFDFWPKELAEHYRAIDNEVMQTQKKRKLVEKSINSGVEYWVETFKSPVIDASGKIIGTTGLARDITEERAIEEKLKLAASIYENSSEGMLVTDADNLIIAVNPAFTEITGYTLEDVLGKNPNILSSGMHDHSFFIDMWDSIQSKGFWQGEICDRKKNGEQHIKRMTINIIRNEHGKIDRHVALFSDITHIKRNEAAIWRQANYDALTGLPNRRLFMERLEQEIVKAERLSTLIAVLFIDLDRFKEVNDNLGHQVGDAMLMQAAQRIESCLQIADTVSRFGGDEFTIILTDLHDLEPIERVAEKILVALREPLLLGNELLFTSGSIGISVYPMDAKKSEDLIKNADQAMYVSKNNGRNRFSYFTLSMQENSQARLRLTADLRIAINEQQFKLYYQPIVELATGRIVKAEALIRWYHPQRGIINPAEFISLAEDTGMIVPMGHWIFKEAANFCKHLTTKFNQEFQISVNKSPIQFQEHLPEDDWLNYLKEIGLQPKQIVVEITEGLLLDSNQAIKDRLYQFRDAGIEVAIDDFGTGYSSLAYLNKFDIDYLKIDQSFTRNIEQGGSEIGIIEAIIVMAHRLGLKVIAEGVETVVQRDLLAMAECDFVQGYFYSRPVPAEEFEKFLLANQSIVIR